MEQGNEVVEEYEIKPDTIILVAKATVEDMAQIRELGRRYGTPYFIDIVRQAVRDALAHFDCPERRKP